MKLERCHSWRVCFFFQAEDGIRDVAVTGVQTCALPISTDRFSVAKRYIVRCREPRNANPELPYPQPLRQTCRGGYTYQKPRCFFACRFSTEIGRASCRERV